ncbi:MAG TPA: competence protein ComG [Firmicutes bacterium]|nr:competence protein ComG [Bacillota bacterium]
MEVKTQLLSIIERARKFKASDIHFVMKQDQMLVQFRVGQLMLHDQVLEMKDYQHMLAFIKFQASLTLSHPKQPQSGLLMMCNEEQAYHCRVSILPTYHYQSLVMRLIYDDHLKQIDEIPYFPQNADLLKEMVSSAAGLVLISGPTGSGKTTTTYALIDYLKQQLGKSIVTIEDPVEYHQPDLVQMQVNESAGMTYDIGIKEMLRHDPDVIVIGEIRDSATAAHALRAAFTGHLVISTLHAKNISGTINRLLDLGMSLHDLQHAVIGIANQRLIKKDDQSKALFEILFGRDLEEWFQFYQNNHQKQLKYRQLSDEFLECEQKSS